MPKMTDLRLGEIDLQLTRGDYEVLKMLRRFHFMRTDQIKRIFMSWKECSERGKLSATTRLLHRLEKHKLIYHLPRRNRPMRGGTYGLVWHLTENGVRILRLREGTTGQRFRPHEPTDKFLTHTLAVVETFVVYVETVRAHKNMEPIAFEVEREAMREFKIDGKKTSIRPDMFICVKIDGPRYFMYIEVDLGTEGAAEIAAKCKRYIDYHRIGKAKEEHGVFPLVLWVVPDEARKEWIRKTVSKATKGWTRIHSVVTLEEFPRLLAEDDFWNESRI